MNGLCCRAIWMKCFKKVNAIHARTRNRTYRNVKNRRAQRLRKILLSMTTSQRGGNSRDLMRLEMVIAKKSEIIQTEFFY